MKIFKNFLFLAGAEAMSKLATFAAFAYLARVLGPPTFGSIEFSLAVLMCASLIVDQGFSSFGAREIAKAPEQTRRLTAAVVTARFGLAAVSYLAIFLVAILIDRGPVLTRLLLIYGLSLWVAPLLLQWVFQGHDRMSLVAIAQLVRQMVFVIMVFAFVRGPAQVVMVAWAEVVAVSITAVFCVWKYRRLFGTQTRVGPAHSRRLLREGTVIGLSQMFWVVRMFGGTIILGFIATSEEVAFFAGSQRILVAMHTFVWIYYFNLLPSMAREWKAGRNEFANLINRSLHVGVWIALVVSVGWFSLSGEAVKIVYGRSFAPAGIVLALFALVWLLAFVSGHYRFGLIACGHERAELMTAVLGGVLALVFVPLGYFRFGLTGAAVALVVAEVSIWLSSWWFGRQTLGLKQHLSLLVLPAMATLLVVVSFLLLPWHSLVIRTVVAVGLLVSFAIGLDSGVRRDVGHLLVSVPKWFKRDRSLHALEM